MAGVRTLAHFILSSKEGHLKDLIFVVVVVVILSLTNIIYIKGKPGIHTSQHAFTQLLSVYLLWMLLVHCYY